MRRTRLFGNIFAFCINSPLTMKLKTIHFFLFGNVTLCYDYTSAIQIKAISCKFSEERERKRWRNANPFGLSFIQNENWKHFPKMM